MNVANPLNLEIISIFLLENLRLHYGVSLLNIIP